MLLTGAIYSVLQSAVDIIRDNRIERVPRRCVASLSFRCMRNDHESYFAGNEFYLWSKLQLRDLCVIYYIIDDFQFLAVLLRNVAFDISVISLLELGVSCPKRGITFKIIYLINLI